MLTEFPISLSKRGKQSQRNEATPATNYFITNLTHTDFIRRCKFSLGFLEYVCTGALPSHLDEMKYT